MKMSYLKTGFTEKETVIDEDGVIQRESFIKHTYIANSKEDFFIVYATLLGVFRKLGVAEIRIYSYLLEKYPFDTIIVINDYLRKDISKVTGVATGTINNCLKTLSSFDDDIEHPLIAKIARGAYKLNPRYAFKGSTNNRNKSLKAIIELECPKC